MIVSHHHCSHPLIQRNDRLLLWTLRVRMNLHRSRPQQIVATIRGSLKTKIAASVLQIALVLQMFRTKDCGGTLATHEELVVELFRFLLGFGVLSLLLLLLLLRFPHFFDYVNLLA
jgi:hypothetical protein